MTTNKILALCNVCLTTVSLICMLLGYREIRRKHVRRHHYLMTTAFACATLFLILFVTRYFLYGSAPYTSHGADLWVYRAIFFTHEPLAVINAPLVLLTFYFAVRRKFRMHRELAPISLLIWVYVSVTGISLFFFLYVLQ